MITYKCRKCNEGFRLAKKPNSCPFCGSKDVYCKAEETAIRQIVECNELVDKLNELGEEYANLLGEYQMRTRNLESYVRRGIIRKEDVPRYKAFKSEDALKEARNRRK